MTRLRVKGAALRNSLYQLTNGYVTQSQTVKVRPGTYRHTNLAADSDTAGKTFGLTWYKDSFHVFAAEEVPVPDGYTLHVLNHPAATQEVADIFSTEIGLHPVVGPAFIQPGSNNSINGPGFCNLNGSVDAGGSLASPGTVGGESIRVLMAGPIANKIFLTITGHHDASFATTLEYPTSSGTDVVDFADASVTLDDGNPYENTDVTNNPTTTFEWDTLPTNVDFNTTGLQQIVTIAKTGGIGTIEPVPLKEIHFAQPFMGFLYIVAEFDVSQAPAAAALGSVFHYWVQTSGEWEADTIYQPGQIISPTVPNGFQYMAVRLSPINPVWTPNTKVIEGTTIEPSSPNGFYYTVTVADGDNPQTGPIEPTWPTDEGGTVIENTTIAGNDVVATPAPQPSATAPSAGVGGKYTNPYSGGGV